MLTLSECWTRILDKPTFLLHNHVLNAHGLLVSEGKMGFKNEDEEKANAAFQLIDIKSKKEEWNI